MPLYLGQFSYTSDAKRALVENPQDREQAAREGAASVGAKLLGLWFAFGDYDGVYLLEAPDNATAAALAMLIGSSGSFATVKTTPLLNMEEAQQAMHTAAAAAYSPPG
jgi:uncharacterized protein with GYD domain